MNSGEADQSSQVKEFKLLEDQELRFEATEDDVIVDLCDGTCEIFGTEIVKNKRYAFPPGSRLALYTWHGCSVELIGKPDGAYVAKQTPMIVYLNTHAALEQMRENAERDGTRGPRIMLVGPTDVGKSTYCKILTNYAVRLGRSVTFVDLDVGQNSITIPGAIAALYVEKPADPVEGFDKKFPLVYHYGYNSPGANVALYNAAVSRLAKLVDERGLLSPTASVGGVIINTCGWVKGEGYECLRHAAEAFEVDVVVVLDHERLYNEMQRDLPSCVKIVHQPKSGGVEDRNADLRIKLRRAKIREYFYGTSKQALYPHLVQVNWNEVEIYKIGVPKLPDSCLPLGMISQDTSLKVVPLTLQQMNAETLLNKILSISVCESIVDEDVLTSNLAGFVCVTEVNVERQTLTLLSPQPYPLPTKVLLLTDIHFVDIQG